MKGREGVKWKGRGRRRGRIEKWEGEGEGRDSNTLVTNSGGSLTNDLAMLYPPRERSLMDQPPPFC